MISHSGPSGGGASGRIDTVEMFQETFGVSRETVARLKTYEAQLQSLIHISEPTRPIG